jgi:hypothetical protein
MYQAIRRGFEYVVVNREGAPGTGPYAFRDDAQSVAVRLTRERRNFF